jgi:hypothetical protein
VPVDLNHGVEAGGVRLSHPPKSRFGQLNQPIIVEDKIQAGVEGKAVGHGSGQAMVEVRAGSDDGELTKNPFGFRHSARRRPQHLGHTRLSSAHAPSVRSGLALL